MHEEKKEHEECEEHEKELSSVWTCLYWLLCLFLISYAGIMSGMTVGFQGINKGDLELALRTESTPEVDKVRARKILPILKKHHLLLVTLLLNNAAAMEALPIFLDALVPSWAAILLSTTAVLVFGEILPMSFFTGPSKVKIAAFLSPFVNC